MFDVHNLIEIRRLLNMSQAEFASQLNITRESVNKMERGRSNLSKRTVSRLKQLLEKNSLGEFSHDVNIFGKTSQKGGNHNLPYHLQRREQKAQDVPFRVPLVAIKAQAGYVKGYEQVDFMDGLEKYSLPPGINPTGAVWRYFEIDGDSMEPSLSAGDVVLATMVPVEDWNDIKNFSVYIILTKDQLLIKRLYRKSNSEWVMISDNEELYPQVLLKVEDVNQLWLFRRHIRSRLIPPKEFKITA